MAIANGSSRLLSSFQGQFDSTVTKEATLYPFEQIFRPLTPAMAVQLQADPYLLLRGRPTLMNISAQFGVQQKALQDATMSTNAPKGKGKGHHDDFGPRHERSVWLFGVWRHAAPTQNWTANVPGRNQVFYLCSFIKMASPSSAQAGTPKSSGGDGMVYIVELQSTG